MPFPMISKQLAEKIARERRSPEEEFAAFVAERLPRFLRITRGAFVERYHFDLRDRAGGVFDSMVGALLAASWFLNRPPDSPASPVGGVLSFKREADWSLFMLDQANRELGALERFESAVEH